MSNRTAILALDAATEACTVALDQDGRRWERHSMTPRGHARELLGMVEAVLNEAGLTRDRIRLVVYGRGPGAFTGVRIGVGVAQGLAWGLEVPVAGVSTLAAIAQGMARRHGAKRVLTAMDARMDEVYWAACVAERDSGLMRALDRETVSAVDLVRLPDDWTGYTAAGTGWGAHGDRLTALLSHTPALTEPDALPSALDLLDYGAYAWAVGDVHPADQALPIYLRDRVTG